MNRWWLALVASLVPACGPVAPPPAPAAHTDRSPVRVEASPRLSVSPLRALHVRVWIEPDAANRGFDVSVAGEHFYRSSAEQLAGADAPRVHDVWWDPTFVPCGRYEIAAATFNSVGRVLHEAHDRALICRIDEDGGSE